MRYGPREVISAQNGEAGAIAGDGQSSQSVHSRGTGMHGRTAASAPFGLPTVWDLRKVVKPGSFMVKNDLRDGFFAVPVEAGIQAWRLALCPTGAVRAAAEVGEAGGGAGWARFFAGELGAWV